MRKTRKKVLLFAAETAYGVDAIDAGETATALLGRNVTITPMAGDNTSLDYDDGTLGNSPEVATEIYGTVEVEVDWAGSGAAGTATKYAPLLQACLRGQNITADTSVAHAIDDTSEASLTLYFHYDGVLHALLGARGTFKLNATAKQFPTLTFTFTGLFVKPTVAAMPAADFAGWQKPLKVGVEYSACTLGGQAVKLISLDYDQANTVNHAEYVGFEEVQITDFAPTGKIVLEAASLGEFDPFTAAKDGTEMAFEFTHGVAGNQVSWASSRVQLGRPTYGDQDGTLTYELPLIPISNVDTLTNA
ncbi:phage tail tube protein [Gallaecimonas xiamenensis]|uniref:Uncharacterized protein n=1 Tax=Gallaecimonas xiamenensis 3-C-1 TaxID=745411 RepID=K2JLC5_9GAMM|nr:phage tail tube protein [Gallaecimonas xiamenensis]EKE75187.1 hypothetical protein B3C1_07921 [Gallaecimonas xiamenensis 3-C-1]